ncbi:hypothetical protein FSARC_14108 [Fusarium sarcochroum]|uniref:Uncharacterized protein n=1 Tax=Fusarium sarcochroum TaxID=1208366 RepID=A0A8H4SWD0_9HYPO|nr:hypothetical protein FSARC_14108 [Fusarium sarcochroum]
MSSIKAVAIMGFLGTVASHPTMNQPSAVGQTPPAGQTPPVAQPPAVEQPPAAGAQAASNNTAAPASRTLWPLTNYGGIGKKPDPALYESEEVFWGDGTAFANMTCNPKDDNKMLNVARLGDWVDSLDCSKSALDVGFKSADAMNKAKSAWQWVTQDPDNAAVVVVDGTECGGPNRRQPYLVQSISYDEKTKQATLSGKPTQWSDVMENANVQVSTSYPATSGLEKRQSADGSVDLAQTFNINIAEINIKDDLRLLLDCVDCRTTGRVDFTANLDVGFLPPSLDISATLTTRDGVGINLGLGLKLEADLTDSADFNKELLSIPLAGFDVPGVATLAPLLSVNAGGSIGPVTAAIEANFGGAITASDDRALRVGTGEDSDNLDFQFTPQDPTLSGSVELSASIGPVFIAAVEASAFGQGASFGIDLKAPTLEATAAVEASSDLGVCDDPNAAAGATLSASAGVSFGIFGGLGKSDELPNEIVIAEVNQELFSKCFPFGQVDGGDDAGDGGDGGAAGRDIALDSSENVSNFDGNNGQRPSVGLVNYRNDDAAIDNGASLWFNANDVVLLSPLSVGDRIADVSLNAGLNTAAKCTLFDSFDQTQGADGCGNLANPITPDLTPGAAPVAIDGKTHLCVRCEGL